MGHAENKRSVRPREGCRNKSRTPIVFGVVQWLGDPARGSCRAHRRARNAIRSVLPNELGFMASLRGCGQARPSGGRDRASDKRPPPSLSASHDKNDSASFLHASGTATRGGRGGHRHRRAAALPTFVSGTPERSLPAVLGTVEPFSDILSRSDGKVCPY